MKKQKSSIIVLSCSESSDDESEKAKPKIDRGVKKISPKQ